MSALIWTNPRTGRPCVRIITVIDGEDVDTRLIFHPDQSAAIAAAARLQDSLVAEGWVPSTGPRGNEFTDPTDGMVMVIGVTAAE